MRRFLSACLCAALLLGGASPALAAEPVLSEGPDVVWYSGYEGLMRRYGTDRMLLVKDGKSGLFGLDGTQYTGCVFDAFGTFDGSGLAPACLNGKWGVVDLDGKTVVDFTYDSQYEAELAAQTYPVFRGKDGEDAPPYALFAPDGTQLTGYKYQSHDRFVNGYAMVTADGDGWGYVNAQGVEITEFKYRDDPLNTAKYPTTENTAYGTFDKDGFAMVCNAEGFNVINSQGRELLETPTYKRPWRAGDGTWGYIDRASGKVGFINGEGTVVVQPQYDDPGADPKGFQQIIYRDFGVAEEWNYHEGLLRFQAQENGPWGFLDEAGDPAVPTVFDAAGYFDRGYASVKSGDTFGLLKNPLKRENVSDWAAAEVAAADAAGYVTPSCAAYRTYTITRRQFAELAVNYVEKKTGKAIDPAPADTFTDTTDEAVLKAFAAGIVQGVGEGRFSPDGPLTREQLAAMLWRAMVTATVPPTAYADLTVYADAGQVSDWASRPLNALVGLEVMAGTGETTLSPKSSCTVEQAILLVYRASQVEAPTKDEAHQAALDRTAVEGIEIGAPFLELPQELLAALEPQGEPYDAGVFKPGEEIGRRYVGRGIEIITSEATEKVLKRALEGQDREYLLEHYGSEDWWEVFEREKGREYVDTVILTGDNYRMVSGLKVGDSGERVRELGYPLAGETYSETAGFDGSATVCMGNDIVTRIEVYDCIGRRIGPFFDP